MSNLARAFSYLIAAQVQAIGLILAAWWVGDWANKSHPIFVSWYAITFPVAILGVAQTFYVVIRHAFAQEKGGSTPKAPK